MRIKIDNVNYQGIIEAYENLKGYHKPCMSTEIEC